MKSLEQIKNEIDSDILNEYERICVIYSDNSGTLSRNEWNNLLPYLTKYNFNKKFPTLSQQRFIFIYKNTAKWGESCYNDISTIGIKFSDFLKLIKK